MASRFYNPVVTFGATAIEECMSFSYSEMGGLAPRTGDNDKYPTALIPSPVNVTASVNADDAAALSSIYPTATSLSATVRVAQGSTGTIKINPCGYSGRSGNVSHGAAGTTTYNFTGYSSDGTTSPLAITGG